MSEVEQFRRKGPASDAEVAGRLLAVAKPQSDAAREAALLDRIMAAAERTPRLAVAGSTVAQRQADVSEPARLPLRRPGPRRDLWAAASVLAASLVIGFVAGQTALPLTAVQSLAEASGVSFSSATQDAATVLAAVEDGEDD